MPTPTTAPPAAPTLDVAAVARRLRVNERTVRAHVAAGRLAHHRVGKLIRFTEDDVAAFVAATRRPTADDVDAHVAALVAAAPPLTDEQRQRLASLLRPVST